MAIRPIPQLKVRNISRSSRPAASASQAKTPGGRHDEISFAVQAGHLRCLAADQGATGLPAGQSDALDDGGCGIDVELSTCVIVQKKEGLSTLNHNVVDAHGNQILANSAKTGRVD